MTKNWSILFISSILVSCGLSNAESQVSDAYDIRSLTKVSEDRFSAQCTDGTLEFVTMTDVLARNVCPNLPANETSPMVKAASRTYSTTTSETHEFSPDLWTGHISFTMEVKKSRPSSRDIQTDIVDKTGFVWKVLAPNSARFSKLEMPVKITLNGNSDYDYFANQTTLKDVVIHPTNLLDKLVTGKHPKNNETETLHTIGFGLWGVDLDFIVKSNFFKNFVDIDCGRVLFKDARGKTASITPSTPVQQLTGYRTPIEVVYDPLCWSSKLPNQENPAVDVSMSFVDFAVYNIGTL